MQSRSESAESGFRTKGSRWQGGKVARERQDAAARFPALGTSTPRHLSPSESYRPNLASFALDLGQIWQSRDLRGLVVSDGAISWHWRAYGSSIARPSIFALASVPPVVAGARERGTRSDARGLRHDQHAA